MTKFLRALIQAGELNPAVLARATVTAVLDGSVMPVSSMRVFRSTLVSELLESVRSEGAQNYGRFLKEHAEYFPNIHQLRQIVAPLKLPETSSGGRPGWKKGQRRFRKR
jgi:hypothetical protein